MSIDTKCAGCCTEDECPCTKVCDETYCEAHGQEQWRYWSSYFKGFSCDNPPCGVQSDAELAAIQAEARLLK